MQNLHKFLEIFICAILRLGKFLTRHTLPLEECINLVGYYGFQYRSLIITHNPFVKQQVFKQFAWLVL